MLLFRFIFIDTRRFIEDSIFATPPAILGELASPSEPAPFCLARSFQTSGQRKVRPSALFSLWCAAKDSSRTAAPSCRFAMRYSMAVRRGMPAVPRHPRDSQTVKNGMALAMWSWQRRQRQSADVSDAASITYTLSFNTRFYRRVRFWSFVE